MKKSLVLLLSIVLLLSLIACSSPDNDNNNGDDSNQSEQTSTNNNEETTENSNTNFSSTGGGILYHNGYTYFISGSTVYSSESASGSDVVRDVYTADFELLRISDDKSASAEVIHTFEMKMPQYLFYANGRIWFTEVTVDSEEGLTTLSMGSVKPDGSGYQTVLSDNVSVSGTKVLGESDGMLYFQQRGEDDEAIYSCFNTKTNKWESLSGNSNSDETYMILTIAKGYVYYVKQAQVGSGDEIGLWRTKLTEGTPELLTRLTEDEAASNNGRIYWATETYFYFVSDDKLKAVSIENGDLLTVIEDTDKLYACNATDDGLYYLLEDGLYFTSLSENKTELKLKSTNPIKGFYWLAVCGDWFVYSEEDTTQEYFRVKNIATQLPEAYFYREK